MSFPPDFQLSPLSDPLHLLSASIRDEEVLKAMPLRTLMHGLAIVIAAKAATLFTGRTIDLEGRPLVGGYKLYSSCDAGCSHDP